MHNQFPFTPGWLRNRRFFSNRDEVEQRLQQAIVQDPEIGEPSRISVSVEKGGMFRGNELHLIGEVRSEKDRARAEEIVRRSTEDSAEIRNEIRIVDEGPRLS